MIPKSQAMPSLPEERELSAIIVISMGVNG